MAHDDDYQAGQKKTCGQKVNDFCRAIWNPDKKEFIGRTGGSWAKIGLFYLIFYSCLAGFFAIMLAGFFATIDDNAPTQQGMYSLIKGNPGMGFRPMVNIESTLIYFKAGDNTTYSKHIENIQSLLTSKTYTDVDQKKNAIECSAGVNPDPKSKEVCIFDVSTIQQGGCSPKDDFGYKNGTPCVLLKVNKVYGWQPQPILNDTDSQTALDARAKLGSRLSTDHIGITCEGENEGDADNIFHVEYYSPEGFAYKYFPYYNYPNYMQPLVFVKFNVRKGVLIQVWCKLWAKNIKHHKNDKAGSSHFELLVD